MKVRDHNTCNDENESLRQQLAAEQAKNVRLLDFIARAPVSSGVCCCGEAMDGHPSPMSCGHSPIDVWDHAVSGLLAEMNDTLMVDNTHLRDTVANPRK